MTSTSHSYFHPAKDFQQQAHISSVEQYQQRYQLSITNPTQYWSEEAQDLYWDTQWQQVLNWDNAPQAQWFVGAKTNICYNCIDRHIIAGKGEKTAFIWEGELGEVREYSYHRLYEEVATFAHALEQKGIQSGDRVLIYMPMVVEATVAMLACARIGAIHSVVFGGFSVDAICDRITDACPKAVITADGGYRRGKIIPLKQNIDSALAKLPQHTVATVFVYRHTQLADLSWQAERDIDLAEILPTMPKQHTAQFFDAEQPLFILYTSGSTGKPKGILHTTAGYMVGTYVTSKYIFDLKENDVYWCTADVGWITGHSYITYGPLLNGVTQVMYEGAPNYPDFSRFWQIVERYQVTIFYTAPTAIRAFIKAGENFITPYNLSSLRLLGTVGEPINPEAWLWYHRVIGGERCPIVDTWWQTETGAIMISPLPGVTATKPGTATQPFFGIDVAILDETGKECAVDEPGKLVVRQPWPSMLRGIYNNKSLYQSTYWDNYPGYYTVGDGAKKDADGNIWIIGRLDDVLNVSGHRLGTAEIESALVAHQDVAEAAVIGLPHPIKGEAVISFVICKKDIDFGDMNLLNRKEEELRNHVGVLIGAIAKPDVIYLVPALPKTRSGKIMRRLLKELVTTKQITGNTTTIEDSAILDDITQIVAAKPLPFENN